MAWPLRTDTVAMAMDRKMHFLTDSADSKSASVDDE